MPEILEEAYVQGSEEINYSLDLDESNVGGIACGISAAIQIRFWTELTKGPGTPTPRPPANLQRVFRERVKITGPFAQNFKQLIERPLHEYL